MEIANAKKATVDAHEAPSINSRRSELATVPDSSEPAARPSPLRLVRVETSVPSTGIWEPVRSSQPRPLSTSDVIQRELQTSPVLTATIEARLVEALTRPLEPGETHHAGGARREREVAALLMELDERDAYQLQRRLQQDRSSDPIVIAFRRLVVDRQQRLRTVLDRHRRARAGRR